MGSALHDHWRERSVYGIDAAFANLDALALRYELDEKETGIFRARARHFTWNPPKGALCEVSLALFEDGSVRIVEGGRGKYNVGPDARVAAQIDAMFAEPAPLYRSGDRVICPPESILWVVDLKSGSDNYVDPVERNMQIGAAAVLGQAFTGAKRVTPALVYWRPGQGVWDAPEAPLGVEQVNVLREELLRVVARANHQRDLYASGGQLTFVEGPWCDYCDSRVYCPAKLAMIKGYLGDPSPYRAAPLEEAQLQRLAEVATALGTFAESVKTVLKAAVDQRGYPIQLADERVWGPHPHEEKFIDPTVVLPILKEVVGEDLAHGALKISISQSAIEGAVKIAHKAAGISRMVAPTVRAIMAKTIEAGGVGYRQETWYSAHRPAPAELVLPARPSLKALPPGTDGDD